MSNRPTLPFGNRTLDCARPLPLPTMRDESHSDAKSKAARAVNRGVRLARISGMTMIVLGALSALIGIADPISPGFLVSVAVLVIGIVEWRAGAALRALDEKAPGRLAINQAALGIVIALYAFCQARTWSPATIDEILDRDSFALILDLYPPVIAALLREKLPLWIPQVYYGVGAVAALGCLWTASFYRSRRRHLAVLADTPPTAS